MTKSVTAAILLGASDFPQYSYKPNAAFLRSKQDFRSYLQDSDVGFALQDDAILDLFDSHHVPSTQLVTIGKFLDRFDRQADREALRNLIVYYVGHGYFPWPSQEYHVALACTERDYESATGLKIPELANVIKQRARAFRRFIFLDCCFAAEALAAFQSGAEDAIAIKAGKAFKEDTPRRPVALPRRGTTLFCAADRDNVALSPEQYPHTMFTDALLRVLLNGDRSYPPDLTLAQVRDLTWENLDALYSKPVRPVLHSPDQSEGDIATTLSLFPNAWRHLAPNSDSELTTGRSNSTLSAPLPQTPQTQSPSTRPPIERELHLPQISVSAPETLTNADRKAPSVLEEHSSDVSENRPTGKVSSKRSRAVGYCGFALASLALEGFSVYLFLGGGKSLFDKTASALIYAAFCFLITLFLSIAHGQVLRVHVVAAAWGTCCALVAIPMSGALFQEQFASAHALFTYAASIMIITAVVCYITVAVMSRLPRNL